MLLCRRVILLHRGMGDCNRPCPASLFASMLLSYHVFLALTSSFFLLEKLFLMGNSKPLSHASRASSPFRGAFFVD